jgi:hypothetical protein
MKKHGFDELQPLIVTQDRRVIGGCTRLAIARADKIAEVPCHVFVPKSKDPEAAEAEVLMELVRDNASRERTEMDKARELRLLVQAEAVMARQRMAQGGRGEDVGDRAGKAVERVGKQKNMSGSSVQKRIKILTEIERAEDQGDKKKAERLTELLEAKNIDKAINVIKGKPATPKKPVKDQAPEPTLLGLAGLAQSNFESAAHKASVPGEARQVLGRFVATASNVRDMCVRVGLEVPAALTALIDEWVGSYRPE